MNGWKRCLLALALAVCCLLSAGCALTAAGPQANRVNYFCLEEVPEFSGEPYVEINGNVPVFTEDELTTNSYEHYSDLDSLGRCGEAEACVGVDLMPAEDRESISSVKPSGWVQAQYDCVDGKYLYNRCHLIGYQLTGENANERNLITGTRYMNVDGMLPFENLVADYVKETENHVMYRVTPVYGSGEDLVATGVHMEAQSVEDSGEGVSFNVYVYNNQPGVDINYATGESWLEGEAGSSNSVEEEASYILNTKSKKFHLPDCSGASSMSGENREDYTGSRGSLVDMGYEPCGICKP